MLKNLSGHRDSIQHSISITIHKQSSTLLSAWVSRMQSLDSPFVQCSLSNCKSNLPIFCLQVLAKLSIRKFYNTTSAIWHFSAVNIKQEVKKENPRP